MTDPAADLATLRKACENAQGADFDAGFIDAREVFAERIAALDRVEAHITRLTKLNSGLTREYNAMLIEEVRQRERAEAAERALADTREACETLLGYWEPPERGTREYDFWEPPDGKTTKRILDDFRRALAAPQKPQPVESLLDDDDYAVLEMDNDPQEPQP